MKGKRYFPINVPIHLKCKNCCIENITFRENKFSLLKREWIYLPTVVVVQTRATFEYSYSVSSVRTKRVPLFLKLYP